MTVRQIGIVGAGAAGAAAARALRESGRDVEVHLIGETGVRPYNRTLVNKRRCCRADRSRTSHAARA